MMSAAGSLSANQGGANFTFETSLSVGDLEFANRSLDFEMTQLYELTIDVWDDYAAAPMHAVGRVLISLIDVK